METNSIKVGDHSTYTKLKFEAKGFSVWAKNHADGTQTWIVGRMPDPRIQAFVPASVLEEYDSPFPAVEALKRWALPLPAPKKPRRVKNPTAGSCRRNGQHPKPETPNPEQPEFELGDPRRPS